MPLDTRQGQKSRHSSVQCRKWAGEKKGEKREKKKGGGGGETRKIHQREDSSILFKIRDFRF